MGVAVFEAQSPMIRHLAGKKIPLARAGSAQSSGQSIDIIETQSNPEATV
jgi:hypothetical protein